MYFTMGLIYKVAILMSFIIRSTNSQDNLRQDRITQDAWIWPGEEKIGIHLSYSDTADWSDLWALMSANGFYTMGLLCVKGAFILYEKPLYAVARPDAFDLISGASECTMIDEKTKSIQLIGSAGVWYGSSITFFEKPYFGSDAYPTVVNQGSNFFQKMEHTESAILIGKAPWTIELHSGERFCLLPDFDPSEKRPICLIRDFRQLLGLPDDSRTLIKKGTQGCAGVTEEEAIHKIQDCFYWTKRDAQPGESLLDDEKASQTGRSIASGVGVCTDEENKKLIFELYNIALTKDMSSTELIGWPKKVGKNAWRLELLDLIFGIVIHAIPDTVISNDFLSKVRESFMRKLVTIWNGKEEQDPLSISERDYNSLILMTQRCLIGINDSPEDASSFAATKFQEVWETIDSIDDFDEFVDPEFQRILKLDVITEMVWLVGHMAGYWCHAEFMDSTYFWALYFNAFWNMYMGPVIPEWTKPTIGMNILFGGYDYNLQYQKLALFTTLARDSANDLEPLDRPSSTLGLEPKKKPSEASETENTTVAPAA